MYFVFNNTPPRPPLHFELGKGEVDAGVVMRGSQTEAPNDEGVLIQSATVA
jgi:hypothetical protein